MFGYAGDAQIIGAFVGHRVSDYAISPHMPGTLYGSNAPYTPRAALVWASYNFIVFSELPFAYFRWRGHTLEQLRLRSQARHDRRAGLHHGSLPRAPKRPRD
jgi:hypothetical protein